MGEDKILLGIEMKGISPLLASVLLIAITVAIATLIMGWMSTVARTTQIKVENKTSQAVDCSSASISIDDVYITAGSAGSANIIVRNTGQVDGLTVQSAQIYNTTGANFSTISTPITSFNKGDIATLRFLNISVATCPTDFSKVIVTTSCGGVTDIFDTTPKCV